MSSKRTLWSEENLEAAVRAVQCGRLSTYKAAESIGHTTMSPSSSGSWSGSRGADIIDLDRYMRGAVRPSRENNNHSCDSELIVDAGGVTKLSPMEVRHKHYSHDSGVSDSSYSRQRRQHKHLLRRVSNMERSRHRKQERDFDTHNVNSTNSLRAFRTVCEQALLDQQRQIAHVAQLCEQLTQKTGQNELKTAQNDRKSPQTSKDRLKIRPRQARDYRTSKEGVATNEGQSESSDMSSSSRSTRVQGRPTERYRTDECKTYKIIMSKLDELNRLFNSKPPPLSRAPPPRTPSSSSVSVCDKVVATDPERIVDRIIQPSKIKTLQNTSETLNTSPRRACGAFEGRVIQAYTVDIAPVNGPANVFTECVVKSDPSGAIGGGIGNPCCNFDLEDPVHLYSQAKQLQVLQTTTERRARSISSGRASQRSERERSARSRVGAGGGSGGNKCGGSGGSQYGGNGGGTKPRTPSLCAVCRGYWRTLTHCIIGLAFPKND